MKNSILISFYCLIIIPFFAQNTQIDVKHYQLQIAVSDKNDNLQLNEEIHLVCLQKSNQVELDLTAKNATGKGMAVKKVLHNK